MGSFHMDPYCLLVVIFYSGSTYFSDKVQCDKNCCILTISFLYFYKPHPTLTIPRAVQKQKNYKILSPMMNVFVLYIEAYSLMREGKVSSLSK